ncbi:MAG: lipopolysaccharide biosynthesis protein [Chitinophagaceae bacterium]
MGGIRKQAIISGMLLYTGFLIGAINIYLYTKNGAFTEQQYGLTRLFFDFAQNIYAFGALGSISVLYKFYPHYKALLPKEKNDLLTWVLVASFVGFCLVFLSGIIFEPLIVKKFSRGSQLFVQYYYWVFPFGFGLLFFSVLEGFCWVLKDTVFPNFLRETALRLFTTVFIALYYAGFVGFKGFITLFSCLYLLVFFILLIYLIKRKQFFLCFTISRPTQKFWKKMLWMQILMFSGTVIQALSSTLDGIIMASVKTIELAGILTLAQYMANLVQVPQRSLQAISIGVIAQAWKDKNYAEIQRVYSRSSINMLLASMFIFGNIVLNAADVIVLTGVKTSFLAGLEAMVIFGICRIIDAGTGVNGAVIVTSSYWRFDFFSGMILLVLIAPTNYFFIKNFGMTGAAYAQLLSMIVYNFIRWEFLRRKFNMQPFTIKTVYSLLLCFVALILAYFIGKISSGWTTIFLRSLLFSLLMIGGVFYFKLTPDALQLWDKWKTKLPGI